LIVEIEPSMITTSKFRASSLKLVRAAKHLDELRGEVQSYIDKKPMDLSWESIPWRDEFVNIFARDENLIGLVPRVRIPIPDEFAPIIGDVVHNLRSALDIMIFDLLAPQLGDETHRSIEFPFWRCDRSKQRSMRFVERLPEVAVLVEAWEPFPYGRSRLHVLHDMWNMDKHRSIIPILGGVEYSGAHALFGHSLDGEKLIDPFPARKQVRDGQPYCVMVASLTAPPLGARTPCEVRLALDGEAEVIGRDLLQELDAHCKVVGAVLESFEKGERPTFVPPPSPGPEQVGPHGWAFPPSMTPQDVEEWIRKNWMTDDRDVSHPPTQ